MPNTLRISSQNCRGLKDWRKRDLLFKDLIDNSVDVCFLQETHCSSKHTAQSWNKNWGGIFSGLSDQTVPMEWESGLELGLMSKLYLQIGIVKVEYYFW